MHIVKSLRGEMELLTTQYETLNHQYIELSIANNYHTDKQANSHNTQLLQHPTNHHI